MSLPPPACPLGYTRQQLHDILGGRLEHFTRWMQGQTQAICDGRRWNPTLNAYEPSCDPPHGVVTYGCDIRTYLAGRQPLD